MGAEVNLDFCGPRILIGVRSDKKKKLCFASYFLVVIMAVCLINEIILLSRRIWQHSLSVHVSLSMRGDGGCF